MLQGSAQLLLRTTSTGDFSAISLGSDLKNVSFGERTNLEESLYYRRRYNGQGKEKTDYNIFTVYKRDDIIGFCPFGIDVDIMGEHFEKSKGNTFRYWNKIRMGLKFSLEKNFTDSEDLLINYLSPEVYFSYLHLPFCARGDLTTKARKGSFMFFILASPLKKYLAYIKFNVGSTWIKPYFKQEDITFKKMVSDALILLNPKAA